MYDAYSKKMCVSKCYTLKIYVNIVQLNCECISSVIDAFYSKVVSLSLLCSDLIELGQLQKKDKNCIDIFTKPTVAFAFRQKYIKRIARDALTHVDT